MKLAELVQFEEEERVADDVKGKGITSCGGTAEATFGSPDRSPVSLTVRRVS